ncbi:MAG: hypothetical protein U1E05_15440 [Patescibacteria group bacterium]|nr:hypothetical protein [Patescibacteria group bacterium]
MAQRRIACLRVAFLIRTSRRPLTLAAGQLRMTFTAQLGHRRELGKGPGSPAELEPLQLNVVLGQELPEFFLGAGQAPADLSPQFRAAPLGTGVLLQLV